MANNLRKFNTYSDYEAAELVKPAVSLIAATDEVYFDQKEAPVPPTPTFSGLTVHYNITDTSQPTELFNGGGGGSGSGSGSGSGGVLPSAMIIDGTAVEVTNTYQFSTTGEHIVNYSFADNAIPEHFLDGEGYEKFSTVAKVEIGDALTSIGAWAFRYCTSLASVTIGNGVTSIGDEAFSSCSGLTSIVIPDSVTSISQWAFIDCSSLTTCTIGSGVTSIGQLAFQGCRNLTSIDIPSGVTNIGDNAFVGCSSLTSITVDSNNTNYSSEDGVLFNKAKTTLIRYPIGNARTSYTISDNVTSISQRAFSDCSSLTSCTIGSGVTNIGNYAFTNCSGLTSITIPDSVTSIGDEAFSSCSSLTSIDIPSSVTSIGYSAFGSCSSLTSIVSNATTAPTISSRTFQYVKTGGTLTVPSGSSGYDVWMQNANYYLGLYGWTKVEQ